MLVGLVVFVQGQIIILSWSLSILMSMATLKNV